MKPAPAIGLQREAFVAVYIRLIEVQPQVVVDLGRCVGIPPVRGHALAIENAVTHVAPAERVVYKFGRQVVPPIERNALQRLAAEKIAGKAGRALGEPCVRGCEVDPTQHSERDDVMDGAKGEFA
ncbi:MAG TPA: hypothetical protein VKH16_10920 [Gemmatimonadales bacterium]|nr:hypothetical protein [Gemmatimonadales bacterium]